MIDFFSLKTAAFGLEITDCYLRMVDLKKKNGKVVLSAFSCLEIAPGIVEAGEVKDGKKLSEAVKGCLKKAEGKKIEKKFTIVSLPEEKSFLQVIQIPRIEEKEIRSVVSFEAENYIPMPMDKVSFDYEVISEQKSSSNLDILIAAFPKKIIDGYVDSIKNAGLNPLAFELESQAVCRAAVKNNPAEEAVLVIHIGDNKTNLIIYSGKSVHISFSIPISNKYFTNIISKSLGIGLKEAEKVKQSYGIEKYNSKPEFSAEKEKKSQKDRTKLENDQRIVFEALYPGIADLAGQAEKYLNYYYTHAGHEYRAKDNKPAAKIVLCGAGANLRGLDQILGLKLKLPVQKIQILPGSNPVSDGKKSKFSEEEDSQFAVGYGLALRGLAANG